MLRVGGRFLCLEFSTVDVPGLDALYDFYSFNVIPALGRAVTGDAEAYRYLVESIRRFPQPDAFAEMMRDGRLPPRLVPAHDRRHRRAAFGLAVVIAGVSLTSPASAARDSCSRARACSRSSIPRGCRCRRARRSASRG